MEHCAAINYAPVHYILLVPHTTTGHLFPAVLFLVDTHLEHEMPTPGRLSPHPLPGRSTNACELSTTAVRGVALKGARLSKVELNLGHGITNGARTHIQRTAHSSIHTPKVENLRLELQKRYTCIIMRAKSRLLHACQASDRLMVLMTVCVKLSINVLLFISQRHGMKRRTFAAPCIHCFFDRLIDRWTHQNVA